MKKKQDYFTPEFIAQNQYIANSYERILRYVNKGTPIKDIECVDPDLKLFFIVKTGEELLKFQQEVSKLYEIEKIRNEITVLRNKISNKKMKIKIISQE